ncbi:MAG: anaerobic ribonucleoside-triphosphate reductase activating protein [Desulfuromonadales bacterium]
MGIKGFQGTSLLDFPGRIASLVFWGGCNLTCPFCHNPALVIAPEDYPDIAPTDLLADLAARKPFIDGIVVSGGEPTLDGSLPAFLEQVKALGLAVKLDTNGLAPQVVNMLLERQLIDYLAIDLKTAPERYPELHGGEVSIERLRQTMQLCRQAQVDLEYRTTCVPGWVDDDVIQKLGELISGAPLWVLQQFQPKHALCETARDTVPFSPERIQAFADLASRYVQQVMVRGI